MLHTKCTQKERLEGARETKTERKIVLVGQPNVGKSVVFHALTGKYATVSNFPGTTVEVSRGLCTIQGTDWGVFDTPGITGFPPRTDDEVVARNVILDAR